jgi:hypothetical protein
METLDREEELQRRIVARDAQLPQQQASEGSWKAE